MEATYEVALDSSDRLSLPPAVVDALRVRLGKDADGWLRYRLPKVIGLCRSRWGIEVEEAMAGGTTAVVLAVRQGGTSAVLKVHTGREPAERELRGWQLWAGKGMPHLFEHDVGLQALLQERVVPAKSLAEVGDRVAARRAATNLLARFHVTEPSPDIPALPTLISRRFARVTAFVTQGSNAVTSDLLERARETADRLLASREREVTLHGDFFPDNILLSDSLGWVAIDPQPCRGDAAFDAGVWSYAYGRGSQLRDNAEAFAQDLDLSSERIGSWALVVAVTNLAGRVAYGHADRRELETTLAACEELR